MRKNLYNLRVALDSRLVNPGDYFVPVVGETHDGHKFIEGALENGAAGIVEEEELYELAREKLSRVVPKIIGVTGSSGKTTTTSFLYQLLEPHYNTALGHLNTKLGLAVDTINAMPQDTEFFVAEMGMDHAGELEDTTSLFPPDVAVITTVNETHMEKLGSLEAIARAKFGIAANLREGGKLVLNAECNPIQTFVEQNEVTAEILWFTSEEIPGFTLPGEHNKANLSAALTALEALGLPRAEFTETISKLALPKGRFTKLAGVNGSTLFDDTYNASPASTVAALENLVAASGARKVAILGDMLELGDYEERGHREVGEKITDLGVDVLITVGELGKIIFDSAEVPEKFHLEKSTDFADLLDTNFKVQKGDVILIKGSQGARMEKITEMLLVNLADAGDLLVRQDARWS